MLPTNLHICNIYLPNSQHLDEVELIRIFSQLPKQFIIMGDFNSHNILWGSHKTDTRGATIAKLINETNPNINKSTHFTTASARLSAIDLTLCNPRIAQNISWNVESNLLDSDHFPIKITYHTSYCHNTYKHSKWKFEKADWTIYRESLAFSISHYIEPNPI